MRSWRANTTADNGPWRRERRFHPRNRGSHQGIRRLRRGERRDLRVKRGTIHALIGPNGAGKTTCFNLLTKFLRPTRGRIVYKGRDITPLPPAEVARLGLVRSFQISAVFPHLTVLENVRVALQRKRGCRSTSGARSACSTRSTTAPWRSSTRSACDRSPQLDGGRTALWPQARARDRDHARARSRDAAARRADGRHGPRGHRPHQRADQVGRRRPHRADGRAQSQRGREPLRPHHRAHARAGAGRGRLPTVSADPQVREAYLGVGHAEPAARRCSRSEGLQAWYGESHVLHGVDLRRSAPARW